jgi:hypothetical protein
MILIPGTTHTITWTRQNLLDEATYYVRAVIRDVRTDEILSTVTLTEIASGRFSGSWSVVQDKSNRGREIDIEKTVYEDSGYTTPSAVYGRWVERYTVLDIKQSNNTGGSSAQRHAVDYSLIAQMIENAVKRIPPPEKPKDVDFSPVLKAIPSTKEFISALDTLRYAIEQNKAESVIPTFNAEILLTTMRKESSMQEKRIMDAISSIDLKAPEPRIIEKQVPRDDRAITALSTSVEGLVARVGRLFERREKKKEQPPVVEKIEEKVIEPEKPKKPVYVKTDTGVIEVDRTQKNARDESIKKLLLYAK